MVIAARWMNENDKSKVKKKKQSVEGEIVSSRRDLLLYIGRAREREKERQRKKRTPRNKTFI